MAFAVTHVLIALIIIDLFRHYVFGAREFPRYLVVIGGIAGLLPDIDIPLSWMVQFLTGTPVELHRVFTHSIMFVFLFILLGAVRRYQGDRKWSAIFYVIAAGWLIHLLLDCSYGGEPIRAFFWPYLGSASFCPQWNINPFAASIDAILLVLWLVHEEVQKKVKDYF